MGERRWRICFLLLMEGYGITLDINYLSVKQLLTETHDIFRTFKMERRENAPDDAFIAAKSRYLKLPEAAA